MRKVFSTLGVNTKNQLFVILCDSQSIVRTLQKNDPPKVNKTRVILQKVWKELHGENSNFRIQEFPLNLADQLLNDEWKKIKERETMS